MGTPLKASDNNGTGERNAERVILDLLEIIKAKDPKKADRVAADFLQGEGFTIINNPNGSCSVILQSSDTPKNPWEVLAFIVRERIKRNTEI